MNKVLQLRRLLCVMGLAALLAIAGCAPASNDGGAGMEMGSIAAPDDSVSLKIGQVSPPFTMILADGSQVSSDDLVASGRPSHLFWFATW